ncbi:MAG: putative metal-dependent hydrolase [Phototrophicales bacterium]
MQEPIERIRSLPNALETLVQHLTAEQLTTPYIPGEWTIAQNIHHLADSQMNLFIRFKLILLEDHPMLKPFEQDDWAKTADSTHAEIDESLAIIRGVHLRLARLLESLSPVDLERTGHHPERGIISLGSLVSYFGDHGWLHVDQIKQVLAAI